MKSPSARPSARTNLLSRLATFGLLALGASVFTPACGRQGEGERCSLQNGDNDCDGSLVCTPASRLRGDGVDRCCPESASSYDDVRCTPRIGGSGGGTGSGGEGGATGEGGASASGGSSGLGTACSYTSDCLEPLVCGPSGECQYECQTARDCATGFDCSVDFTCVPESN